MDEPAEQMCELLREKMAKTIPQELMPEFQHWLSLEQSLSYSKGRADEAMERSEVRHFVAPA